METPTNQISKPADMAAQLNSALVRRVARWKRLRLGVAIALGGAGIVLAFFDAVAIFAAPLFIGASIACLLYLDARDEAREIKSRKWGSPTPRISKLAGIRSQQAAEDTSRQN
jgi:hypothetical protein